METYKSIPEDEIRNLIRQNKEFLSALDQGASSTELEEIKNSGLRNNENEIQRSDAEIPPHISNEEAA